MIPVLLAGKNSAEKVFTDSVENDYPANQVKGDIFMERLKKVGDVKKFASREIRHSRLGIGF